MGLSNLVQGARYCKVRGEYFMNQLRRGRVALRGSAHGDVNGAEPH